MWERKPCEAGFLYCINLLRVFSANQWRWGQRTVLRERWTGERWGGTHRARAQADGPSRARAKSHQRFMRAEPRTSGFFLQGNKKELPFPAALRRRVTPRVISSGGRSRRPSTYSNGGTGRCAAERSAGASGPASSCEADACAVGDAAAVHRSTAAPAAGADSSAPVGDFAPLLHSHSVRALRASVRLLLRGSFSSALQSPCSCWQSQAIAWGIITHIGSNSKE